MSKEKRYVVYAEHGNHIEAYYYHTESEAAEKIIVWELSEAEREVVRRISLDKKTYRIMDIADLIGIIVLIFTPIVAVGTVQMLVDHRERKQKVKEELDKMWNRIEWLCRDTDDRLRLELQQKSKQVRNLWKRLRYVEKRLYIEPSDAFKEKEDGE